MDHMADIRDTFFLECDEQLSALEVGLFSMQDGSTSSETVNAVFRAVHSIKGGAGAFKLTPLVDFAHVFETALDMVRSGKLAPDQPLLKLMLRSVDILSDMVSEARDNHPISSEASRPLVAEFEAIMEQSDGTSGGSDGEDEIDDFGFQPVIIDIEDPTADLDTGDHLSASLNNHFAISFQPHRALYDKANDPQLLFRELERIGAVSITCDTSGIPLLNGLDPEEGYLSWSLSIETPSSQKDVEEVFEFVEGDCNLQVSSVTGSLPEAMVPMTMPLIVADSAPSTPERTEVKEPDAAIVADGEHPSVTPLRKPDNEQTSNEGRQSKSSAAVTIRVDLDRVDRLINLVGELVINQAMLSQRVGSAEHASNSLITSSLEELEHLTRDLQESVMAIRAQPVKPLFQRMARTVREVADATGRPFA